MSTYSAGVIALGPLFYFRLDETSGAGGAIDSSGNGRNGLYSASGVTYQAAGLLAGDGDKAVSFDGSAGYTYIANSLYADTFTLEAWLKPASTAAQGYIIGSTGATGAGGLTMLAGGQIAADATGVVQICNSGSAVVAAGTTHHVAYTKNGAANHLYLDGVDVTTSVANHTCTGPNTTTIGQVVGFAYFNGTIDEVAVYGFALSPAQVAQNHTNGITAVANGTGTGAITFAGSGTATAAVFTLVGSVGAAATGANNTAVTPAWGAGETRTAGNLLICWAAGQSAGGGTAPPATPSGWSVAAQQTGTGVTATVFYKVAAGGDTAPTFPAAVASRWTAMLAEYSSRAGTAGSVDRSGLSTVANTSPVVATASAADAANGELLLACGSISYTTAATKTVTQAFNNAAAISVTDAATSTLAHSAFSYANTTTNAGADTATLTFTTAGIVNATTVVVSFAAVTAGVTGTGTGAIVFAGSGTATQTSTGTGTGAISFAGTGVAGQTVGATGSGAIVFNGSGNVLGGSTGTGTGAIAFNGSGTATAHTTVGTAGTGAIGFDGSGTATVVGVTTAGTGAIAFNGTGTATATGLVVTGAGQMFFDGSGTAAGGETGDGTGTIVFGGAADLDVGAGAVGVGVPVPPEWAWYLTDPATGNYLEGLTAATARKLTFLLDGAATATFTMPASHPQTALIHELGTDIAVGRNGRLLFRGRIGASAETHDATTDTVNFTAVDYRGMLAHRVLWLENHLVFPGWDQSDIAWTLIADTQAMPGGNLGITRGVGAVTGVLRDRTYTAGTALGSTIDELGRVVGGFDWDIDAHLAFNLYSPQRGRNNGQILTYGRDVVAVTTTINPDSYANAVFYTGAMPATIPVETAASSFPAGVGRWDTQKADSNAVQQATVDDQAAAELAGLSTLVPSLTVTLAAGIWNPYTLWLGDTVRAVIQTGRLNLDVSQRVVKLDVALGDDGTETVTVDIGAAPARLSDRLKNLQNQISALQLVPTGLGGTPVGGYGGYPGDNFGGGGGFGGGITEITSSDGTVGITSPTGPVVDLSVPAPAHITVTNGFGPVVDLSYTAGVTEEVTNFYATVGFITGGDPDNFGFPGYSYAWYSFASGPAPTVDWLAYVPAAELGFTPDVPTAEDVAQIIAPGIYTLAITFETVSDPIGTDSSGDTEVIVVGLAPFVPFPFGSDVPDFYAGADPSTTITTAPAHVTAADLARGPQYAAWGFQTFPTPTWNTAGTVKITVTLTRAT